MSREHIHFVTGKLAEPSLRGELAKIAPHVEFTYSVEVLNITVAALMTTEWAARRMTPPAETTRILLPGLCMGELEPVEQAAGRPAERGPKDLRELGDFFGQESSPRKTFVGDYNIEILAEITRASQIERAALLTEAASLKADGADVIDLGCHPDRTWREVGDAVRALRDEGFRVSVDTMNEEEIALAARAGAELVLSVRGDMCQRAADWGCEVVVVPRQPHSIDDVLREFAAALALFDKQGVKCRLDPILELIGFGFADSLERYWRVRREFPQAEIMMGIGNLTEMTDADSAAINVLLLGYCQELGIRSVLTTQVVHWAKNAVKECDLARRLAYYAVTQKTFPKHAEPRLIPLRGDRPLAHGQEELDRLAQEIKDRNVRLFAEGGKLHAVSHGMHLANDDPFVLFEQMQNHGAEIDADHAFYLGFEMAKALTALTLNKHYRQDEALDWGYLTRPEISRHERRQAAMYKTPGGEGSA